MLGLHAGRLTGIQYGRRPKLAASMKLSQKAARLLGQRAAACCSAQFVRQGGQMHVCRPRGVFSDAHVAGENDPIFFAASTPRTLRGILINCAGASKTKRPLFVLIRRWFADYRETKNITVNKIPMIHVPKLISFTFPVNSLMRIYDSIPNAIP